jgi:tripartite ATP-independent transporter DctM subunit
MDPTIVGVIGILLLFLVLLTGLHIGLVLCLVGGLGLVLLTGFKGGLTVLGSTPFATASAYDLSPLPLFLLMGAFAAGGGLGTVAFEAISKWVGRLNGGLAIASTFGSAFFGLACGSSLAAAGVFTKAALPEMLARNYDRRLAIGSIAAAGTFSTMIPPSGLLIIYAIFTDESIGRLFMAGVVPGALTAVTYAAFIFLRVSVNPNLAPKVDIQSDWPTRMRSLMHMWPILLLAGLVLGGIFAGWFTATEAGGIGAAGALTIVLALKGWRNASILKSLIDCMRTNGMIFLIIIGAIIFGRFLSVTQVPVNLSIWLSQLKLPPTVVLMGVLLMYFILGMLLDAVAILAITLPVVFPLILELGFDPIWFAIVMIKVTEIGLVTPPVGMNVYVCVSAAEGQVTLPDAFYGIAPFILCDLIVLGALLAFPQIALWLPGLMFN